MHSRKSIYRFADFWIVTTILLVSVSYAALCEIFPTDWFLSSAPFKKNSQYHYVKKWDRLMISNVSSFPVHPENYLANPDKLFENTKHLYKDRDKKNKVALVQLGESLYIVKKYKTPTFWRWLKAIPIKASKGFRVWYFGIKLKKLNISTARPILVIEKRIGPFWTSSYVVLHYIPGLVSVDYFAKDSPYKEKWGETLAGFSELIANLNKHQIIHGDLNLDNIIIYNHKPYLIDLDSIHFYQYNHAFYKSRYRNQHLSKLNRKLGDLSPEAQNLFEKKVIYPQKISLF
jgi:hypothetical protein